MKKLFSLLTAVCFLVCFCSCNTAEDKDKVKNNDGLKEISTKYSREYQTTANINYNGTNVKVNIEKTDDGTTEVSFEQPEMLDGMKFSVTDENIAVSYLGMTFNIDPENLSSSLIVSTIVGTFNTIASGTGISAEVDGSKLNVTGATDNVNFLLVLDKKSGNALNLEVPSMGLSAEFENFTLN